MIRSSRRATLARAGYLSSRNAIALAVLASPLLATSADAASKYWDGGDDTGASGSNFVWLTPTNWLGDAALAPTDDFIFQSARSSAGTAGYATTTVTSPMALNGNITVHSILFDGSLGKLPAALAVNNNSSSATTTGRVLTLAGDSDGSTTLLAMTGYSAPASVTFSSTNGTMSVALGSSGVVNVADVGSNLAINSVINSGGNTYGLTKIGSGTLTLGASNTFIGGVTINGGTVSVSSTTGLGNVDGSTFNTTTLNGGTLQITGAANTASAIRQFALGPNGGTFAMTGGDWAFAGIVSGSGSLTKSGAATLTLSAANTYSGVTQISTGSLRLTNSAAMQNSTLLTAAGGGTLTFGTGTAFTLGGLDGNGPVVLTNTASTPAGATLSVGNNNANTTHSGVLSGLGGITKIGTGALTLSGANTFTGTTTLSAGTLNLGAAAAFGGSTAKLVLAGGAFDNTSGATATSTLSTVNFSSDVRFVGTNNLVLSSTHTLSGTGPRTITVDAGTLTLTGAVGGATGLVKSGPGTLAFTSTGSTYSGGLTINGGSVTAFSTSSLGIGGTGAGGQIGTMKINAGTFAYTQTSIDAALASTFNVEVYGAASGATSTFAVNSGSSTFRLDGTVSGSGSLTKGGAGALILNGSSSYQGSTIISAGTLQIGGTSTVTSTTGTLAAGPVINGGSLLFRRSDSIVVPNDISGTGSLNHSGSATLTLTGAATYTGGTTVASPSGILEIADGATFASPTIANAGSVVFNRGQDITYTGIISGSGGVTKTGTGTLTLTASNSYQGGLTVNQGTVAVASTGYLQGPNASGVGLTTINNGAQLQFTNTTGLTASSARQFAIGTGGAVFNLSGGGTIQVNAAIANSATGSGGITKRGSGKLYLANLNTFTGPVAIEQGMVQIASANSLGATTNAVSLGAATLYLYNDGDVLGSYTANIGSRPLTITSPSSTVQVGNSNGWTIGSVIDGGGTLNKIGANTLTLSGTNTYTGGTVISGGTVSVVTPTNLGPAGSTSSPNITSIGAGTLTYTNSSSTPTAFADSRYFELTSPSSTINVSNVNGVMTVLGRVSGTGQLNKTGAGTLSLNGTNNYAGPTVITDGTVRLNGSSLGATPTSPTVNVVLNGGTLEFDQDQFTTPLNANRTIALGAAAGSGNGTISATTNRNVIIPGLIVNNSGGVGALTKAGPGTVYLTNGNNSYSGGTTISAGTLRANNAAIGSATGSGDVTVASGGTLGGNGTIAGKVTVNPNAVITAGADTATPGKLSTGDQTWAGGSKYLWKTKSSTGSAGTEWDLLNIGTLAATGTVTIQAVIASGGTIDTSALPAGTTTYQLAHTTNTESINVASLFTLDVAALNVPESAGTFTLSFDPGSGGYDLNLTYQAAPEPTTAMLVGLGAASLLGRRRRKAGANGSAFGLLGGKR